MERATPTSQPSTPSNFEEYRALEVSLVSAQRLNCTRKKIKTYAKVWIYQNRKLKTRIDKVGGTDPVWNERFVFAVTENFLANENSMVSIEVYRTRMGLRDKLVDRVKCPLPNVKILHKNSFGNEESEEGGDRYVKSLYDNLFGDEKSEEWEGSIPIRRGETYLHDNVFVDDDATVKEREYVKERENRPKAREFSMERGGVVNVKMEVWKEDLKHVGFEKGMNLAMEYRELMMEGRGADGKRNKYPGFIVCFLDKD